MKIGIETDPPPSAEKFSLQLPFGLIGLPKLTDFSLSPIKDKWPFLAMNWLGGERLEFVVIDPIGLISDYEVELSDEDAEALQIQSASDALVLAIVTVHTSRAHYVTVNLMGPVVVNRHTGIGKQIITLNCNRYSSHYPLIDQRAQVNAA